MTQPSHLVFVYGTLKRGFPNHHYMAGARFIGMARTVEAWPLVVGNQWFSPYLLPERGVGHRVTGELWEVPESMMPALDELESVHLANGYRRERIGVEPEDGGEVRDAWAYLRERRFITTIHSEPMADYQDRRYVARADRD
ncbi:MAG: gamma-glutamylcyclotransferase family protein [Hyphomicrobiaceae bacterium]